ncbi:MAG: NTPase [Dehalococcoidia bacterium]|nr:NTPase [Dehalococcoidia bacterium]
MKKACLLTGDPGVGKTTIIKQALNKVQARAGGFFTEEIRAGRVRQGFRIVTLDGHSAILAHIDIKSPYRVSKYGVDIESLDKVGVAAIREAIKKCDLVVIDEIGKMELFSPYFKEAVLEAINSEKRVLGTIMRTSHPWADEIKRHPNVALISLTKANQEQVLGQVLEWLKPNKQSWKMRLKKWQSAHRWFRLS